MQISLGNREKYITMTYKLLNYLNVIRHKSSIQTSISYARACLPVKNNYGFMYIFLQF